MIRAIGRGASGALVVLAMVVAVDAQTINITGTVIDSTSSAGINGATIALVEYPSITTTTNASGAFTLAGSATAINQNLAVERACRLDLNNKKLTINGAGISTSIVVDVFSCNGSRVFHAAGRSDLSGMAEFANLTTVPGLSYVKANINGRELVLPSLGSTLQTGSIAMSSNHSLGKLSATYTLRISATGYSSKNLSMTAATGSAGTIKLAAPAAQTGIWTNVTPSAIALDGSIGDNYGAQDIVVDPQRPSDLYAFTCHQGVWKSTDFGATFTGPINTGAGGATLNGGKQWMAAITNTSPSTKPTLYTANGASGVMGIFKSTDGGVSWVNYQTFPSTLQQDVYSIDVDPYDNNHLVVGFHERSGIAESTDGGATWKDVTGNVNMGTSWYVSFVNTGNAATTRTTWIASPQAGAGTNRTTNGGAQWTQVESVSHEHGQWETYQPGTNGVIFIAGVNGTQGSGVYRSTDYGVTWAHVGLTRAEETVVGTPTHLYSTEAWPCGSTCTIPTNFEVAPTPGTTGWVNVATPTAMTYGAKRMTVTFDGTHYIIVAGCWNAGMWRYIEP